MKKKIQKPFNVEAAKNGAKVETREGRSVRILCYDKVGNNYPIVALLNMNGVDCCASYTIDGKLHDDNDFDAYNDGLDLVIIEEVEETKFNVGDYIAYMHYTYKLNYIDTMYHTYHLVCINDNSSTHSDIEYVDKYFHKWTIRDAKPGDVLICEGNGHPFIFKEDYGGVPSAYCGIDTNDSIRISDGRNNWTVAPVRPATYKERQQLFNMLKEEGYKWDAESLTLTKIPKRWRDNELAQIDGYFMNGMSQISFRPGYNTCCYYNLFATEKQTKSALAMSRISQIMANDERFGGVVTDNEWGSTIPYFVIAKVRNMLVITVGHRYEYLGFHTMEQAKLFLEENEDLVKDYYMMD